MNKELLYGIGGVVIGLVIMLVVQSVNEPGRAKEYKELGENSMHELMMGGDHGMGSAMNMMTQSLLNKTGLAFDQEFLSEMIVHHEGAVQMAELALKNAQHQELKDLANNIITAQNKEIQQMKEWQKQWTK